MLAVPLGVAVDSTEVMDVFFVVKAGSEPEAGRSKRNWNGWYVLAVIGK